MACWKQPLDNKTTLIPSSLGTGSLAATTSFPAFKAPTGPLSFSQNVSSSSALSNGSGFTWGNSMDAAGGAAKSGSVSGGAADEGLAEEEGPKVFTPEAAWDDRGHGTLTVREQKSGESAGTASSANIVFTTESGRILVNGEVYKGIKINQVRKTLPP
ncbi:hypothetical protein WJX75_002463 [Coccomyxa subellipsoidea]|uniref:Uncharacterized protein n=1 Tax=Coccomyxa subellipsoidea TaxID=248742 RepID=A0ABR2YM30_9CHLO